MATSSKDQGAMTPSWNVTVIHSSKFYLVSPTISKWSKMKVDIFHTCCAKWYASYAERQVKELKVEKSFFFKSCCEVNQLQRLCSRLWLSLSFTTPQRDDTSRTCTCSPRRWVSMWILTRTSQSRYLWWSSQVASHCSTHQLVLIALYPLEWY